MTVKRHRGLTEQAAGAAIEAPCKALRLPTIRGQFADIAEEAAKGRMTYRGFVAELLLAECDDRARRRSERRIKAASFRREKSLRQFDFDANPNHRPGRDPHPRILRMSVPARTRDLTQLVVGELVTNACKYAPGPVLVELRISAYAVDVVVWDSDPTVPAARLPDRPSLKALWAAEPKDTLSLYLHIPF
ncbi:ATP-binding protein, partial [Streptomyces sp. NPDC048251]|uniref:ATP-binding protein n=1 Tax=Streptomyces sp. NPDC048251 TaxID=3154501 RepID=UPI003428C688